MHNSGGAVLAVDNERQPGLLQPWHGTFETITWKLNMDWLTVVMVQFKGAWRVLPSELPAKELMASDVWHGRSRD